MWYACTCDIQCSPHHTHTCTRKIIHVYICYTCLCVSSMIRLWLPCRQLWVYSMENYHHMPRLSLLNSIPTMGKSLFEHTQSLETPKQHNLQSFLKNNELPSLGFEHIMHCFLNRYMYTPCYQSLGHDIYTCILNIL